MHLIYHFMRNDRMPSGHLAFQRGLRHLFLTLAIFCLSASAFDPSDVVQSLLPSGAQLNPPQVAAINRMTSPRLARLISLLRNPTYLAKLRTDEVEALFGTPDLVRRERNVAVLHYGQAACTVDVYYRTEQKRPVYVDWRHATAGKDVKTSGECLLSLALRSQIEA